MDNPIVKPKTINIVLYYIIQFILIFVVIIGFILMYMSIYDTFFNYSNKQLDTFTSTNPIN